jgi:hypothetical protein
MMQEEADAAADEEDRLKILVCLKNSRPSF